AAAVGTAIAMFTSIACAPGGAPEPSREGPAGENVSVERSALTSRGLTLFVPAGVANGDVAVAASRTLKIDDHAQIQGLSGATPVVADVGPTGGGTTTAGADTVLPSVWSAGPVTLADRAHVTGSLFANASPTFGSNDQIAGTTTIGSGIVRPRAVAWSV